MNFCCMNELKRVVDPWPHLAWLVWSIICKPNLRLWHETPFHIKEAFVETRFGIGEGPEKRPLCDLRSVPEAGKRREQVKNHKRTFLT